MSTENEYILEFRGVSKHFPGVQALDNVSFGLYPGKVHAVMGENGAGKSTLMKCLLGLYTMDKGEMFMEGKPAAFHNIAHAQQNGLSIIQQELAPVLERSIMENIWLNRELKKNYFFTDPKAMYRETLKLCKQFDLDIDPKTPMKKLTVAQSQMIDIIKAVSFGAKIVMMDEPTSALTTREIKMLFAIIRRLTATGVAIMYVTHKMEEIAEIADQVTILRDGKWIGTHEAKDVSPEQIIKEMVGRALSDSAYEQNRAIGEVVLCAEDISAENAFLNVSFEMRKGEVLGLAGLVGSGRTELLEAIYGMRRLMSGTLRLNGKPYKIDSPERAIAHGMVLLPEERRKDGIFPIMSVLENVLIANYDKFVNKMGFVQKKHAFDAAVEYIKNLNVKTPSPYTKMENLSGGNQQKVLLARLLLSQPEILLLDEPTRGIDVGAKSEIHDIIIELARKGKSVLVVSSEMPELLKICDRIIVMHEGHVTGIIDRKEATQEVIMKMASAKINRMEAGLT